MRGVTGAAVARTRKHASKQVTPSKIERFNGIDPNGVASSTQSFSNPAIPVRDNSRLSKKDIQSPGQLSAPRSGGVRLQGGAPPPTTINNNNIVININKNYNVRSQKLLTYLIFRLQE
jgi:hypothetical protein